MEFNLDKLKVSSWIMLVLLFISVVCPSFLLVYVFNKSLFLQLEFFKLLFLGLSITCPLWLINVFLIALFTTNENPDDDIEEQGLAIGGALVSFLILYVVLSVHFFTGRASIKLSIGIGTLLELVGIIFGIVHVVMRRNRKQKK